MLFLTDGQPTVGKSKEADILSDTKVANKGKARLFAFGVGYDPNVRLLDKLVADNNGRSDYVKPKEPIESKVSSLYTKIKNPVMTGLKVSLRGLKMREMYPRSVGDLFDGDQILLVGRYDAAGARKLPKEDGKGRSTLTVKGRYQGRDRAFEYPVTVNGVGRKSYQFVEKLWAIRRVGWLLDQIQLHGKSKEIVDELVRLSRDYGIMTPYTSFLADETTRLSSVTDLRRHGKAAADNLMREIAGAEGQMNAASRMRLNRAWNVAAAQDSAGRAAVIGNTTRAAYEQNRLETVSNMRLVNNQAVYQRGRVWIAANAADVDPDRDKDRIQDVRRFSSEYFALVRTNTTMENQLLASQRADEELIVRLRGQTYRIR